MFIPILPFQFKYQLDGLLRSHLMSDFISPTF